MKKIFLVTLLAAVLFQVSCADKLDVYPTDKVGSGGMMDDETKAIVALNGIYRYMFQFGQTTTANGHQCFGPQSYTLMADLMGDDLCMKAMGSGWFWYDYLYDVKGAYANKAWRPYDMWNFYYTVISNVNYIIAAEDTMQGSESRVNYIVGQAYALRAYCYHYLAMSYCRTYIGHENDPGVPIYTEPTVSGTPGVGRGTVQDVYDRATTDINKSIALLANAPAQEHKSHIDYRVANAIKARIYMHMDDWDTVLAAAQEVQKTFGGRQYRVGEMEDILSGLNSVTRNNVMWGAEIIQTQGTTNPQFLAHMDANQSSYGRTARKTINALLYNKMSGTDVRLAWWDPKNGDAAYQQEKFKFSDYTNWLGDRVYMRVEESILMEAEALCRLGRDGDAVIALKKLMDKRDPEYNTTKTGTALGTLTTDETGSLLEEIITQRRIELWGEYGRVWDIRRLKQGLVRTTAMGHPAAGVNATNNLKVNNPETWDWVMTIPQAEFDANEALDFSRDQNPIDSGI